MRPLPRFVAPGYCDPEYRQQEHWLKDCLDSKYHAVVELPIITDSINNYRGTTITDTLTTRLFYMHKYAAHAPHVGRPFAYMWRVFVDNDGRAVASESVELVYMVDELEWRLRLRDPEFNSQMEQQEWRARYT